MIEGVIITKIWTAFSPVTLPERIRSTQIIQEEAIVGIVANDVEEVKEVGAEDGGTPS